MRTYIGWLIVITLFLAGLSSLVHAVDHEARQDEQRKLAGQMRIMKAMYIEAKYRSGK